MQTLIEIDKETLQDLYDSRYVSPHIKEALRNGVQLPEHGDLVDRDGINSRFNAICDELESLSCQPTYKELLDKLSMCLDTAEPVIKENYKETEEELWK